MTIAEVLAELKKHDGDSTKLTEEQRAFLLEYSEPTPTVDNDAIRAARKRAEDKLAKREAEMQVQMETLREEMEELQQGTQGQQTDWQKQHEKLQAKMEAMQKQLSEETAAHEKTKRTAAINRLSAGVKWVDGISDNDRMMFLNTAFADVDSDDLSDTSVTQGVLKQFQEERPWAIQANAVSGTGDVSKGQAPHLAQNNKVDFNTLLAQAKSDPDAVLKNIDAIEVAHQQGVMAQ